LSKKELADAQRNRSLPLIALIAIVVDAETGENLAIQLSTKGESPPASLEDQQIEFHPSYTTSFTRR
jgi:hypothetical protein